MKQIKDCKTECNSRAIAGIMCFIAGAAVTVAQSGSINGLSAVFGNYYAFPVMLCAWLAGSIAGAGVAGFLTKKIPSSGIKTVSAAAFILAAVSTAAVFPLAGWVINDTSGNSQSAAVSVTCAALTILPAFFISLFSRFIEYRNTPDQATPDDTHTRFYYLEALGGGIAGILCGPFIFSVPLPTLSGGLPAAAEAAANRLHEAFWFAGNINMIHFSLVAVIILITYRELKKRTPNCSGKAAVFMAIFFTGFFTMATNLMLINSLCSLTGNIAPLAPVLLGAFMLGIAGGDRWGRRLIRLSKPTETLFPDKEDDGKAVYTARLNLAQQNIFFFLVMMLFLMLFLPPTYDVLKGYPPSSIIIFTIGFIFTAGIMAGIQFPLAANYLSITDGHNGSVTRGLYITDLLGGFSGAFIGGLVLVPFIGMAMLCLYLSILCAALVLIFLAL